MKNKILAAIALVSFVLAGNAYAVFENSGSASGSNNNQLSGNEAEGDLQVQVQYQEQNGEEAVHSQNLNQNQNQNKNQGEEIQEQEREQEKAQAKNQNGLQTAAQRRSSVANAVQEILQIGERNQEIGDQIKIIAQAQNHEKLEASLEKIRSRNVFARFFIGPDYGEINNAKRELEKNEQEIYQFNELKKRLINREDSQNLNLQIQILEQANLAIENSLKEAQKGFSLFGWMFRLFSR